MGRIRFRDIVRVKFSVRNVVTLSTKYVDPVPGKRLISTCRKYVTVVLATAMCMSCPHGGSVGLPETPSVPLERLCHQACTVHTHTLLTEVHSLFWKYAVFCIQT